MSTPKVLNPREKALHFVGRFACSIYDKVEWENSLLHPRPWKSYFVDSHDTRNHNSTETLVVPNAAVTLRWRQDRKSSMYAQATIHSDKKTFLRCCDPLYSKRISSRAGALPQMKTKRIRLKPNASFNMRRESGFLNDKPNWFWEHQLWISWAHSLTLEFSIQDHRCFCT